MGSATATSEQKSGAWLVATHKVEDFARWKPVFDGTATLKRAYGWKHSSVYTIDGDRNNVLVMEEFDSLEHAKAFASSPELKAAMGSAGIVGAPETHIVSEVAS